MRLGQASVQMTMETSFHIRDARAEDAPALAQLIDIAGEGIPRWLWSRSCDAGQDALEIGVARARREAGGFSYRNALVATQDGEVLGMALSYPILEAPEDNPNDLPAPIAPFVALEAQSVGTWYVNALATRPGHRGRGIGSQLMSAVEAHARSEGVLRLSIQVFEQNSSAVKLYTRLGYRETGRAVVQCHPCQPYYTGDVLLLEKPLA